MMNFVLLCSHVDTAPHSRSWPLPVLLYIIPRSAHHCCRIWSM